MERSAKTYSELAWAISARGKIQAALITLLKMSENSVIQDKSSTENAVFTPLVGAAFSLWRASFLTREKTIERESVVERSAIVLRTLVTTNTFVWSDDLNNEGWTVAYYTNNASYRLIRVKDLVPDLANDPAFREFSSYVQMDKPARPKRLPTTELWDVVFHAFESSCEWLAARVVLDRSAAMPGSIAVSDPYSFFQAKKE